MMERFQKDREETTSDMSVTERYRMILKCIEYENLEEQGLLLRLPCKVGDTVYVINSFHIDGSLRKNSKLVETKFNVFMFDYIGKTVFLTREEAEAKLKETESE